MRKITWSVAVAGALMLGALSSARAMDNNIRSYVCQKLDDFSATLGVVKFDAREMAKISKDSGIIYRFKDVRIRYKEPNMVRMDVASEGTKGVFILNGSQQWVSVPKIRLKTYRNFGNSPGKRKSLMDVGLISDYYLTYTNARFWREAKFDGIDCAVFQMTYKDRDEDTSHQIVYIDPRTRVVRRREAYSQDGKLQAIYLYNDIKEVRPGIWFPTVVEARTPENKIAGITAYRDIQVNTDLPDSLFRL